MSPSIIFLGPPILHSHTSIVFMVPDRATFSIPLCVWPVHSVCLKLVHLYPETLLPTRHRSQTLCLLPLFSVLITPKYRNSLFHAIWASDSTSISFKFSVRDKETLECEIQVWVGRWKLHYQDEEGRQTRVCCDTSHPVWVKHQYEDKTQSHI